MFFAVVAAAALMVFVRCGKSAAQKVNGHYIEAREKMRCDDATVPNGSDYETAETRKARRHCAMLRQAAAQAGFNVAAYCAQAVRSVPVSGGYWKQYSKKRRCPLAVAFVACSRALPLPDKISPCGVYTIRQAAAFLNMPPAVVRRLIRCGRLVGFADIGGSLLWGGDLLRFISGGIYADGKKAGDDFGNSALCISICEIIKARALRHCVVL